jgi:hypothetical protein
MSVLDTLEKRIKEREGKVSEQGNRLNSGAVYELEIEAVKCIEGFSQKLNRKTAFFVPEVRVISCHPTFSKEVLDQLPLTKRPNEAGSTAGIPWPLEEDWGADNAMRFMSAVTGEPMSEISKEKKLPDGRTMSLSKLIVSEMQPLKSCRIMCESFDKALKGKENSTNPNDYRPRQRFFHTESTQAATAKVLA